MLNKLRPQKLCLASIAASLLISSSLVSEPIKAAGIAEMSARDTKYADVAGIRTCYYEQGEGETLLLVHGGQPSSADYNALQWHMNFASLAENYRVIALDRIGQGCTDNPANLDDYENYYSLVIEHLLGFMDELAIKQAHLVGHSQGGWPVTRIAIDHPERVQSLVVVDSTMIGPALDASQAVKFYMYLQNELHPPDGETAESIRRGMEMFTYAGANVTDEWVERTLEFAQTEKYQAARKWFLANYMSPAHPTYRKLKEELWADLEAGKLEVPTLIIWGREDPEGSYESGKQIAAGIRAAGSDVTFHTFEKTGHVAYLEHPEDFNQLVTGFIRDTQKTPR
jgi:2-hydroxy-6-oxo-6-(2'-carboxyphenyl)-hexa-2,4-dienoate hydrolase